MKYEFTNLLHQSPSSKGTKLNTARRAFKYPFTYTCCRTSDWLKTGHMLTKDDWTHPSSLIGPELRFQGCDCITNHIDNYTSLLKPPKVL